jgi:hypothetical protein
MKTCHSLLLALGLAGCATHYAKPPKSWWAIRLGMNRQEVRALIGQPQSHEDLQLGGVRYERDHWEIRTGPSTVAGLMVTYGEDGRVIGVGPGTRTTLTK